MEKVNFGSPPTYVGPLSRAEDGADKFISGMIYCGLLEKLLEQQTEVDKLMSSECSVEEKSEAIKTSNGLELVWISLANTLSIDC
jgi:hypothetical protein